MGCSVGCTNNRNKSKEITSVHDLIIKPSTFVKINSKEFYEVYALGRFLGAGAFAEVYFCRHILSNAQRAVKIFDKNKLSPGDKDLLLQEIEVLKLLDHPSIVSVYEFFEDLDQFYIVMEHCKGGELFHEIVEHKIFTEKQTAIILKQLLSAVSYLHSLNIVHRDLKPENIVFEESLDDLSVKIIDFGTAIKIKPDERLSESLGTLYYTAPEVFDKNYNEKCDLWSIGVIMYVLFSSSFPFRGQTNADTINLIKKGEYSLSIGRWNHASEGAKDLVRHLLVPEKDRYSASEAFSHSFINVNTRSESQDSLKISLVLDNLCSYHYENKLAEAIWTYITSQLISSKQKKELAEVFKILDTNGDGKLSKEELIESFKNQVINTDINIDINQVISNVDSDHSGFVDYNEFLRSAYEVKEISNANSLKIAFNMFDLDGDGLILASELKEVLQGEMKVSDTVWKEMIDEVDINKDGAIDFHEFELLIIQLSRQASEIVVNEQKGK
ncbi:unnamed protein product [Blepharisma stoltei]|uniref:non-specific serine/threonine protein kinase n=1 Tax=Blepharisma stoltei TaxID=1481888 RepID=A0AAU9K0P9_9CILI|nr:unnamed protein product [Blepharisma stoltei]